MFPDRESAEAFTNQIQDHNPGITEEGLFWTQLIAPESATWQAKRAQMCLRDQFIPDMETFENAVVRGPMIPSTIDVEAVWEAVSNKPEQLRDEENQFVFNFRFAEAEVHWRATEPNVTFESVETGTPQQTLYAAIGVERNGHFFS